MNMLKTHQETEDPAINICPLASVKDSSETRKELLDLQLQMATCSINHEYARKEFEDTKDFEEREDLLAYMHDCRCQYFQARASLETYDPYALVDFEADLMRQKQMTFSAYNA